MGLWGLIEVGVVDIFVSNYWCMACLHGLQYIGLKIEPRPNFDMVIISSCLLIP